MTHDIDSSGNIVVSKSAISFQGEREERGKALSGVRVELKYYGRCFNSSPKCSSEPVKQAGS